MKILQIVTRSEPGGAQTIVRSLAETLSAAGHEILVASGPEGGGEAWRGMPESVRIVILPHLRRNLSLPDEFRTLGEISALYRSFSPDCVHLHTSKAGLLGRIAGGIRRGRIVYTMHGFDQLRIANSRFLFADKMMRRFCGAIVAVSEHDEDAMRRAGYVPVLIPNGTKDARLHPKPAGHIAAGLSFPGEERLPLVLTVARDAPPKRSDLVCALATRFRGRARFVWIGGGGSDEVKGSEVGGTKCETDELIRLGSVPDAAACLSFADIFLLASDHEGLPVSLLEAMSAGLPCLASEVGGVPELLAGDRGISVSNTVEAFSAGLERLLSSESLRLGMGETARTAWKERYSVERMASSYEELYRRCLAATRSGSGTPAREKPV